MYINFPNFGTWTLSLYVDKNLGWPYENSSTMKREIDKERVRERESFSDGKWLVIAIITTAVITRHYIVRSKSIFSTGVVDDRRSRSPPLRDVDTMPSLMICVHSTDEIASGSLYISLCSLLDGRVFFLLSFAVRRIMSLDGTSPFKWTPRDTLRSDI